MRALGGSGSSGFSWALDRSLEVFERPLPALWEVSGRSFRGFGRSGLYSWEVSGVIVAMHSH